MRRISRPALAILATALVAPVLVPTVASAESPLTASQVTSIVRDYLLREPEILEQAAMELEKRRDAQALVQQRQTLAERSDEVFRQGDDPVVGNANGDVTLVEFFDYRCFYCRQMAPTVRALLERDKGVRLVFKDMPVFGPESVAAARMALAARKLDPSKFLALHFALMQDDKLDRESMLSIAEQQGYDRDRLAAEMDSDWAQARIDANLALAQALGIQGSPSFAIGDQIIPGGAEIDQLAELVAAQRRSQS